MEIYLMGGIVIAILIAFVQTIRIKQKADYITSLEQERTLLKKSLSVIETDYENLQAKYNQLKRDRK